MSLLELGVPLERSRELQALDAAIATVADGRGGTVLVEGPPGIGKTRLLREAAARAETTCTVLTARGDLIEWDLPFGIVRQLFEEAVAAGTAKERLEALAGAAQLAESVLQPSLEPVATTEPARSQAIFHGLYWLTSNLSAVAPVMLIVDDLHWADVPSLEWLGYLARRLEGMPVLLVAGARRVEGERLRLVEALTSGAKAEAFAPLPLSPSAVREVIVESIGSEPDPAFVDACVTASGGNPFLLGELLRAAEQRGLRGSADEASGLAELAPDTVIRSVLVRLEALPEAAGELARAVAVLGPDARLERAASLAGLTDAATADAADALAAAHVLAADRELRFIHPIVRTAVEESMAPSLRRRGHADAARILAGSGADPERLAAHLLIADPAADSEVVETLRESARRAQARGSTRAAVTYLERALEEPPSPSLRPEILTTLGEAAAGAADPRAEAWLREANEIATDPAARGRCALALGRSLFFAGRPEEAFTAIDVIEPELGTGERRMAARLEAELIAAARLDRQLRPRVAERLNRLERLGADDEIGRSLSLCQRAYELTLAGEPATAPVAMAREGLDGGAMLAALGPEDSSVHTGINALALNEHTDEALTAFDEVVAAARQRGSALGFAIASCFRSQAHYRRGDVRRAEADARASVEVAAAEGWGLGIPAARAFLISALLERGDLAAASEALADAELLEEVPDVVMFDPLLESRGRVRIASGQVEEGVADLLACGERQQRWGAFNPSVIPWRSMAAEALLRIGKTDRARELADEEVEFARRTELPRAFGMALRVAGLVRQDQGMLEEAISSLERGPSALELARARVDLGGVLRRARHRSAAQEQLRIALDEADRAGAGALVAVARRELLAAGSRPRRARLSGREALTASELRVAEQAAEGISNREIAQSLFITVKTVESHLGNAYGKLGISSRSDLPAALEPSEDA